MTTPQLSVRMPDNQWQKRLTGRLPQLKHEYLLAVHAGNAHRQQLIIAETYHLAMPYLLQAGPRGRIVMPDMLDWVLGEVQQDAWHCIRNHALPLYPHFPVLGYYVSFADPYRRLAVEIESAPGYWRPDEQARQDETLTENGWQLCRIPYEMAITHSEYLLPEHLQGCEVNGYDSDQQHAERRTWDEELARRSLDGFFYWLRRHGCYSPSALNYTRQHPDTPSQP